MKNKVIALVLLGFSLIIFGAVLIAKSIPPAEESGGEGLVKPVHYYIFEPMEIKVPVTEYDFSNEEPMLITPDKKD